MKSLKTLLEAAEYVERYDHEIEHDYASTRIPIDLTNSAVRKAKSTKNPVHRNTHNQLEKTRRAHLRYCLERLKDIVPVNPEIGKHTTVGLLNEAKRYIKCLEKREAKSAQFKEQLSRDHRYLRRKLEILSFHLAISKRRSVSECSNYSITSFSSNQSSLSESDEIDVVGYVSSHSDTEDDDLSVESVSSDSGVTMSTSRLNLCETIVL